MFTLIYYVAYSVRTVVLCKTVRFIVRGINHTNPIVKPICNIALTSARSPVGANMAFLRCKYGADFDSSVHTLLNCINV